MGTEGTERGWEARTAGESKGEEHCLRLPPSPAPFISSTDTSQPPKQSKLYQACHERLLYTRPRAVHVIDSVPARLTMVL